MAIELADIDHLPKPQHVLGSPIEVYHAFEIAELGILQVSEGARQDHKERMELRYVAGKVELDNGIHLYVSKSTPPNDRILVATGKHIDSFSTYTPIKRINKDYFANMMRITDLGLTSREENYLVNRNIRRVGDLRNVTEAELLRIQNFGRRSLENLKERLSAYEITWPS